MRTFLITIGLMACSTTLAQPTIHEDGSVAVPAHTFPVTSYLSDQGKAYLLEHLQDMQTPSRLVQEQGVPVFMKGYLDRQYEIFKPQKTEKLMAGVPVYDYTANPNLAENHKDKVLINLHGGGFMGCWPGCAELESIPLAARGYRVVSINYRQSPEHEFPAASEDVAAVYTQLLKDYPAEKIGIYGCSAGGMLTSMSVAWFHKYNIPLPGAVGVLCAGLGLRKEGFAGDSVYFTAATGEARNPPQYPKPENSQPRRLPYLANAEIDSPLVSPVNHVEYLAAFPPTLMVTGIRSTELSSVVYGHSQLVKQGIDAQLHVWEGMFHGFFYNMDVPESLEYLDVIDNFFADTL